VPLDLPLALPRAEPLLGAAEPRLRRPAPAQRVAVLPHLPPPRLAPGDAPPTHRALPRAGDDRGGLHAPLPPADLRGADLHLRLRPALGRPRDALSRGAPRAFAL